MGAVPSESREGRSANPGASCANPGSCVRARPGYVAPTWPAALEEDHWPGTTLPPLKLQACVPVTWFVRSSEVQ